MWREGSLHPGTDVGLLCDTLSERSFVCEENPYNKNTGHTSVDLYLTHKDRRALKNKYFRYIFRHFVIWTLAVTFWNLMRDFGHEVISPYPYPSIISPWQYIRATLGLGLVAGVIFGNLSYFFEKRLFRRVPLGKILVVGGISYMIGILLFVTFGVRIFSKVLGLEMNWNLYSDFIFSQEMILLVFYCILVGFTTDLFRQIDRKLGPGNLLKMIRGEFYYPKEDERIFMFIDLKSSTAIAEKLGHLQFSNLIQDCFKDLEVVEKYQAEIYQYVGDEVVLTWQKEQGLKNANCLMAFFAFRKQITRKESYYSQKYGILPEFKAGLNIGKIMIAEVGQIKTEIAFHGDAINTAARIQDQCNNFNRTLLISEELKNNLVGLTDFSSEHVGDVLLKGKSKKVNIYSVEDC